MPEFELRQAADEGTELVVLLGGQGRRGGGVTVLETVILAHGRVEFRREESEEEVEEVDPQGVCDWRSGMVLAFPVAFMLILCHDRS